MTIGDISTKITNLTNCDTTQYSNANRLIDINIWYRNLETEILKSQDSWDFDDTNNTDFPIITTNLIANQQDYSLPVSTLEIKRAEITFDGVNWYPLNAFDNGSRLKSLATNSLSDFVTTNPYYDVQYGSVFLYPIPTSNVTAGLKLWVTRTVTDFTLSDLTTGTKLPGIDPLFQDIIAYGTAFDFCMSKGLPQTNNLKVVLDEKLTNLRNHYSRRAKDEKMSMTPYWGWWK